MLLINTEKKAIYIPIPKTGTKYIINILTTFYNFKIINVSEQESINFVRNDEEFIDHSENNNFSYNSITIQGITRFILDGDFPNFEIETKYSSGEIEGKDFIKDYFLFTFICDPYRRFNNGMNNNLQMYIKNKFNNDEKIGIVDFIKMKDKIHNLVYYKFFISQYNHLINYDNEINYNYIGITSNIEYDLMNILYLIGFKEFYHLNVINRKLLYNFEYIHKEISLNRDEVVEISKLFNDDFENLKLNKCQIKDDINEYTEKNIEKNPTNTKEEKNIKIFKLIYKDYINNIINDSNIKINEILKVKISDHMNVLNKVYKLHTNRDFLLKRFEVLVRKYFETFYNNNDYIKDITPIENYEELLSSEPMYCSNCLTFKCFNNISLNIHENNCKTITK